MSQILCRKDSQGKPVVFLADSVHNGQIAAWRPGDTESELVSLDFYHSTDFLAEDETDALTKKFSKASGQKNLILRQRLPRKYMTRTEPTGDQAALQAQSTENVAPTPKKRGRPAGKTTAKKRGRPAKSVDNVTGGPLTKRQANALAKQIAAVLLGMK